MVAYSFNSQQHTPQYGGGGGGLPANDDGSPRRYKVVIVNSGLQNVEKNGMVTGGYMAFELTPVEGPLQGTKHTDRLNLNNTNPQTVEIANKQLSAYCHVLGKFQFQDTAELHNIPFFVDIGLQKEPNPNKYTEVKAIFDINGNEPGKAGAGPQVNQGGGNNAPPSGPPAGGVEAQGQWGGQGGQGGGNPPANNGGQGGGWGGQPDQSQQGGQQGGQAGWGGQQGGQPQSQGGGAGWGGQGGGQPPQNQQQGGGQWGGQGGGGGNPPGWGAPAQ